MQVLRSVVDDAGIVRRQLHWGYTLKTKDQVTASVTVERLCSYPVRLGLTCFSILNYKLTFARTIDDVGVRRMWDDWAGFTARAGPPIDVPFPSFCNARENVCAVVLLSRVQPIRESVIKMDSVDF